MKPRIAIPVPHTDADYAGRALPPYVQALEEAGAEPVEIPLELENRNLSLAELLDALQCKQRGWGDVKTSEAA